MRLGLDVGYKNMSMAIVKNNEILNCIDKPIATTKRDSNRAIMDKMLTSIHSAAKTKIKGIGLSLPSKIDERKGVVYDIGNIPYWKGMGIKKILEDEFNTKVWINNDVNCFLLGEKYYGMCKDFKDIICISLGPNAGASFMRTMEELNYLIGDYKDEMGENPDDKIWSELGVLIGRLVSILLCNYDPQVIVLGGSLAKHYVYFSESMDKYLEKFIHPQVLFNMIIFASIIDHQQALGATSMVKQILI